MYDNVPTLVWDQGCCFELETVRPRERCRGPEGVACRFWPHRAAALPMIAEMRPRPTKCFVRMLPSEQCTQGPLAVLSRTSEPMQLDVPCHSADGRLRSAVSARFDGVYCGSGEDVDGALHEGVSSPLARCALDGSCATLCTYGATGSGKSHNVWRVLLPRTAATLFAAGVPAVEVAVVQRAFRAAPPPTLRTHSLDEWSGRLQPCAHGPGRRSPLHTDPAARPRASARATAVTHAPTCVPPCRVPCRQSISITLRTYCCLHQRPLLAGVLLSHVPRRHNGACASRPLAQPVLRAARAARAARAWARATGLRRRR
jgi:hypothetical protein